MFVNRLLLAFVCSVFACAAARADDEVKPMPQPVKPGSINPIFVKPPDPGKIVLHFQKADWSDLIDWYARQFKLTRIGTVTPKGTFSFQPPREARFTEDDITDILNDALVDQKLVLLRRNGTFFVHPVGERVEPKYAISDPSELERLTKWDYASVLIVLKKTKTEDMVAEVKKVLGPYGSIVPLQKGLLIQDIAGNLRPILKLIQATDGADVETPKPSPQPEGPNRPREIPIEGITFKDVAWGDVLDWYSKATGLKADVKVAPKGSLTLVPGGRDRLRYTLGELTDHLNEALAQQKLHIVRGRDSFYVGEIEKIDPKFVPPADFKILSRYGRSELVEVALPVRLDKSAEEVADELKKLLTSLGAVVSAKDKWVVVRDTAGSIEHIRDTLAKAEPIPRDPPALPKGPKTDTPKPKNPFMKPVSFPDATVHVEVAPPPHEPKPKQNPHIIPLAVLDPALTATVFARMCCGRGPDIEILKDEEALLVYATDDQLKEIRQVLRELGEPAPKVVKNTHLVPIHEGFDVKETANTVRKLFPAKTVIVPLPDEHALLVYMTDDELKELRKVIRPWVDPAGPVTPEPMASPVPPSAPPPAAPPAEEPKRDAEKTFPMHFKDAKWEDVLAWYEKISELKADVRVKPKGTVTVGKGREFTVAEIADLIHEALRQQNLWLILLRGSFVVASAEDKIDSQLVPVVERADLPKLSKAALVRVTITLPLEIDDDITAELKKVLTPFGELVSAKGRSVTLRETVGNINRMSELLKS